MTGLDEIELDITLHRQMDHNLYYAILDATDFHVRAPAYGCGNRVNTHLTAVMDTETTGPIVNAVAACIP